MNLPSPKYSLPENAQIVSIGPGEFHRVLHLLETAFPDVSRTFFHALIHNDPFYNPRFTMAIQLGNRLVSCLHVFDRRLAFQDKVIHAGGIGSVGTHPRYRGRGFASILLQHAEELLRQEGMHTAFLFTKIQPFYERLGWRILPQWEQVIPLDRLQPVRPAGSVYRPLVPTDIPFLHDLYVNRQTQCGGTLIRTRAYWEKRSTWMSHTGMIVLCDQQPCAYLYGAKYREDQSILTITEFATVLPDPDTLGTLAGAMARLAEEKKCTRLRGFFLQDPDFGAYAQSQGWLEEEHPFPYLMWRDLGDRSWFSDLHQAAQEKKFLYWQTDAF